MAYENILYLVEDGIALITVNRPKVLNALNSATYEELREAFLAVQGNEEVKAVILTGSGDKAFVAGADINELAVQSPVGAAECSRRRVATLDLIENLGKPVLAAVNGFALGGGCELAMACHIRIASTSASFG
ncbi:MAG: enoyl-CoA hydratase/isomerase family protein, partial [Candidatus Tectomicrobia bacterium]|nr:enoyl-CoA hydratase/isomerase family protein [Candidatus Tectomicrobia bacterium]